MSLAKKLQIPDGMKMYIVGAPKAVQLGLPTTSDPKAGGVLVFVKDSKELAAKAGPAIDAAKVDRLSWIAYPKGGQLGTDLNRDILWQDLLKRGIQGIRQVSIDEVWSALRFRPAK